MLARTIVLILLLVGTRTALSDETAPSMAFLEFLGEWEGADEEWMDSQIQATAGKERQQQEVHDDE